MDTASIAALSGGVSGTMKRTVAQSGADRNGSGKTAWANTSASVIRS